MFLFERNTAFVLQGSLPGDCHASLAMTEYFVRNVTRVCLLKTYYKFFVLSLFLSRETHLCHCEAPPSGAVAISRKGHLVKSHARYFCTCVEKKAHTSKRVSVIACDNVISKVQLSGTPRDTCTRGEKAHTSKRQTIVACDDCLVKSAVCAVGQ